MQARHKARFRVLVSVVLLAGVLSSEPALSYHFIRGDASQDGIVDMSDALEILGYLFLGEPLGAHRCLDAADADDNGKVEMADAMGILEFLFLGEAPPPSPYPTCGPDLSFDGLLCEVFEPCGPPGTVAAVTRGPQLGRPGLTTGTIAWRSAGPTKGTLEYGPYGRYLGFSYRASEPSARTEHVMNLQGLTPGTTYFYRILHDGKVVSDGHTFATHPADPDAPLRFCAFGDSTLRDASYSAQQAVATSILAGRPDLVLVTGDAVTDDPQGEYFDAFKGLIDHIPYYPSFGNHEQFGDALGFRQSLYLPAGGVYFYSFDRGNSHFIALNTNEPMTSGSAQYAWLQADLARTSARWIFVFFHEPPYSTGPHGSRTELRLPLFDQYHVDVVFNGHDHGYQRSFPMRSHQVVDAASEPNYVDPRGTVYVVTGGGGAMLYGVGKADFTAYAMNAFHHTRVDVQGCRLTLSGVLPDGTVFDRMTITKTE